MNGEARPNFESTSHFTETAVDPVALQQQQITSNENSAVLKCLRDLPEWVHSPTKLKRKVIEASHGLTDKTSIHAFHHLYHHYLSQIALRTCLGKQRTIRLLEIGLGCSPKKSGGMRGAPGGSALAWSSMFAPLVKNGVTVDTHHLEFDSECALKWYEDHKNITTVHTGDATSAEVIARVYKDAGNKPFDVVIDDGSHMNAHQIQSLDLLFDKVAPGGVYIVEDMHASCKSWNANTGKEKLGLRVSGTEGCMETLDGNVTFYAKIVEWQKKLLVRKSPMAGLDHIDMYLESVVFQKSYDNQYSLLGGVV